ncbi:MAG TPA: D-alanyl-D-alanine carboxypeptidase, partial [Candidatus Acidoferrales bacterium]|nr:D-alanyl-D-alanine carboxypeptidase [Candidatus Acidoferrales bacterium]
MSKSHNVFSHFAIVPALPRRLCALSTILLFALASGVLFARTPKEKPTKHAAQAAGIAEFTSRVNAALSEAQAQKAFWGILIADRDTGKTLYELNADRFFAPASNAKLFVTSLALSTLGPDYRYRTTLESKATLST